MKKWFSLLLVLAIVFSLLAGCGTNNESPSVSNTTKSVDKNESTNTSTASNSNGTKNSTIKVYAFTPPYKATIDQFVSDYKTETGNTVEWEIPGEEPYAVLKARFAADEGPDIFFLAGGDFPSWGARCLDLSNESWQSHVEDVAVPLMTIDGKRLGFPCAVEGNGIVYNKDLFKKAGITEIPDTLDKLEQVSKQLKTAGIQPFGEAWKNWGFLMHIFGTTFAYEKDPAQTSENIANGQMKLKDLKNIDNFFRLYDMTLTYGLGKESIGYDYSNQISDFANGKMAMIKQGTWYTSSLAAANPKLNIGLFAVPLTNNSADTKLMVGTTSYLCINKDSKNVEASKEFLNWFSTKLEKYLVQELKLSPPYDNVKRNGLGALSDDMNKYVAEKKVFSTYGSEYWPSGFNTDLATPLQAYAAGALNKEKCIDELQKAYDKRVLTTKK